MLNRDEKGDGSNPRPRKRRGRTAQELRDEASKLRAEARKRAREERAKREKVKRREDGQRKVAAGTFLLEYIDDAKQSGDSKRREVGEWLERRLHQFLTRDRDRRLFGLAPREDLSPEERGLSSKRRKDIDRDS